jgi:phosphatidylglycerophosphate synthase
VGFAASTSFALPEHRGLALVGFIGALLCDAADGALARRLESSSAAGKLLDQLADTLTFTFLMLAIALAGLASIPAAAFAVVASVILLVLGFRHHTLQRPAQKPGSRIYPRGGFYAHCPKAIVYAALASYLLFQDNWLDPALYGSNVLAVVFGLGFLWAGSRRPAEG